jgi:hypothetical protein
VAVFLPADFHDQGAAIAVVDDGEGMDATGLKQHWLIGKSDKRDLARLPRDRKQIGKFGIGMLATYVLANRLTHISKRGSKYYPTSMNFKTVDERGEEEVEPKAPIKISLRELTEDEAKQALSAWTGMAAFQNSGLKLFGGGAAKTWTFAILSDLKAKVHEIRRGRLEWMLRTALPLRDDFSIYLDGAKLEASKVGKGRLRRWVLGKDIEVRAPQDKARVERAVPTVRDDCFGGERLLPPDKARMPAHQWCLAEYGLRRHSTTQRRPREHVEAEEQPRVTRWGCGARAAGVVCRGGAYVSPADGGAGQGWCLLCKLEARTLPRWPEGPLVSALTGGLECVNGHSVGSAVQRPR